MMGLRVRTRTWPRVRGGRLALPALLVVLAVAVTTVLLRPGDRAPSASAGQSGAPKECVLQYQVVKCTVLDVNGTPVRYALLPGTSARGTAVLVDLGGPGLAAFGEHWVPGLREALPPELARRSLLLLEEPWVTADAGDGSCTRALSDWFVASHDEQPTEGTLGPCRPQLQDASFGWTPQRYRDVVNAVSAAEHIRVDTLLGRSFAGERFSYLQNSLRQIVLVDPSPKSMSSAAFLTGREQAVLGVLAAACPTCGGPQGVADRLDAAAAEVRRAPIPVGGRSVALKATDVAMAAIAVAYSPVDRRAEMLAAVLAPRTAPALVGGLADSIWQRYGRTSVSPAYLAYLREVCAAYPGWSQVRAGGVAVAGAFLALHAPCTQNLVPVAKKGNGPSGEICVVSHAADPVVPAGSPATWSSLQRVRLVLVPPGPHGDLAAAEECGRKEN